MLRKVNERKLRSFFFWGGTRKKKSLKVIYVEGRIMLKRMSEMMRIFVKG